MALVDGSGCIEAQLRVGDDAAGYRQLVDLLADHGDRPEDPIPVAIETGRGLLVACLHATGRAVCTINPLAAARTANATPSAGAKATPATPSSWPTSCVPTPTCTDRFP